MATARKLPAALKALRRQLDEATDGPTRDRLLAAIEYVKRLYGLPVEPTPQDEGDMRRRRAFVKASHPMPPRVASPPPHLSPVWWIK